MPSNTQKRFFKIHLTGRMGNSPAHAFASVHADQGSHVANTTYAAAHVDELNKIGCGRFELMYCGVPYIKETPELVIKANTEAMQIGKQAGDVFRVALEEVDRIGKAAVETLRNAASERSFTLGSGKAFWIDDKGNSTPIGDCGPCEVTIKIEPSPNVPRTGTMTIDNIDPAKLRAFMGTEEVTPKAPPAPRYSGTFFVDPAYLHPYQVGFIAGGAGNIPGTPFSTRDVRNLLDLIHNSAVAATPIANNGETALAYVRRVITTLARSSRDHGEHVKTLQRRNQALQHGREQAELILSRVRKDLGKRLRELNARLTNRQDKVAELHVRVDQQSEIIAGQDTNVRNILHENEGLKRLVEQQKQALAAQQVVLDGLQSVTPTVELTTPPEYPQLARYVSGLPDGNYIRVLWNRLFDSVRYEFASRRKAPPGEIGTDYAIVHHSPDRLRVTLWLSGHLVTYYAQIGD